MGRRALVLCTSAEIGGMERLAVGITRQLRLRQWDAELVFGEGAQSEALLQWSAAQGVPASTDPAVLSVLQPRRSWSSVWALARLVRSRRPDVVLLHYGGAHISLKDVLAVRLARVPRCVVEVHLPVQWEDAGRRKRRLTRVAAALVDGVIVHSEAVQSTVGKAGVPPSKIHRVNPGLARPQAGACREAARRDLGLPPGAFVVGCMARLVPHKGVADLVCAMRGTPADAILLVAGDGPEREPLERLAAEVAPGRVHFLGMLGDEADRFFAALDLFVLPSHREGFGLVIIEAAMRGVPAIGTRIGGVEDAVVDGETGLLVPVGDIAALAAAINELWASPERRGELGVVARTRALRDFSEDAMGSAVEEVLRGAGFHLRRPGQATGQAQQ